MKFLVKLTAFALFWRFFLFFVNPPDTRRGEQCVALKFLAKSGQTPIECWRTLKKVWGDETMCCTQV